MIFDIVNELLLCLRSWRITWAGLSTSWFRTHLDLAIKRCKYSTHTISSYPALNKAVCASKLQFTSISSSELIGNGILQRHISRTVLSSGVYQYMLHANIEMRLLQGLATMAFICSHVKAHWPAAGCGPPTFINCKKPLPQGQELGGIYNMSISTNGIIRSFLISIPPCYTSQPETPVILSYHGGTRNASFQLELDEFTNPEFNRLAIVVYPQGLDVCVMTTRTLT